MRRALRLATLATLSFAVAASALWLGRDGRKNAAFASDPGAVAPAPQTRLLFAHGEVDGFATEIAVAAIDPAQNLARVQALATLTHPRGSAIRGAAFGDVAFVVAKTEAPRNTTWDSALYRVERGKVVKLCEGIEGATTPWVTGAGRVVVARGVDGPEPAAADTQKLVLRTDELTLDEVDASTGAARTVWRGQGYQAFVAGRVGGADDRLVVYHSHKAGASLFLLDPATGQTRTLGAVAPFARDFSFDRVHGRLLFADLGADGRTYEVLALDLASLARKTLFSAPNEHLMPFALPSGDVVFSSDGDKGLAIVPAGAQPRLLSPLGDGSDAVTHADGRWVALRHTPKVQPNDDPPRVVAFDTGSGKVVALDVPTSQFVEPFAFLGAAGGAQ